MNLAQLRQDVRNRIQEPQASTWTDAEINGWLNNALDDLSEVAAYEETYQFSSVAGQETYALPADCLHDGFRRLTWAVPQGGSTNALIPVRYIERDEYDRMKMMNIGNQTMGPLGIPPVYTIWGNQIYLYPIATTNGNNDLMAYYYGFLPYLSNDTDIPAIPRNRHEALVLYAVARCQEMIQESNMYAEYMQQYEAMKQMFAEEMSSKQRDMPRMVRDVYDWGW